MKISIPIKQFYIIVILYKSYKQIIVKVHKIKQIDQ